MPEADAHGRGAGQDKDVDAVDQGADNCENRLRRQRGGRDDQDAIQSEPRLGGGAPAQVLPADDGAPAASALEAGRQGQQEGAGSHQADNASASAPQTVPGPRPTPALVPVGGGLVSCADPGAQFGQGQGPAGPGQALLAEACDRIIEHVFDDSAADSHRAGHHALSRPTPRGVTQVPTRRRV